MHHVGFEQLHGGVARGFKTAGKRLGFGGPVVQVAIVQGVLQLLGRAQLRGAGCGQMVLGAQGCALRVGQLVPIGVGVQLGLLLLPGLLKGLQLGVKGLAQHVHRFIEQGAHGVGFGQQAALRFDGVGLGFQRGVGSERFGMVQQLGELAPRGQALGDVVRCFAPGFGQANNFFMPGEQLQQLGVAGLRFNGLQGRELGCFGCGGWPACLGGLVAQFGQQGGHFGQFFFGLAGHAHRAEQRAYFDELRGRDVDAFALKVRLRELGAVQAFGIHGL